jgi:hypothetical protein
MLPHPEAHSVHLRTATRSEYEAANKIHIGSGDINLFKIFDTRNCTKARRLNFNMKMDEANTELLQLFEYIKIKCCVEITSPKPRKLAHVETVLTCIRYLPDSNLGRGADYSDSGSSWFSSAFTGIAGMGLQILIRLLFSTYFPILYSLIQPFGPTKSANLTASFNKF